MKRFLVNILFLVALLPIIAIIPIMNIYLFITGIILSPFTHIKPCKPLENVIDYINKLIRYGV